MDDAMAPSMVSSMADAMAWSIVSSVGDVIDEAAHITMAGDNISVGYP